MNQAALQVEGLRLAYGDLTAVWDVSMSVAQGKICALVGRNGVGKTTFLLGVAGLLPAKAGSVRLGGTDVTNMSAHRRARSGIALVQEGKRVFRSMTVRENLLLGTFAARARSRAESESAIEDMYERFPPLGDRRKARAGELSGGQQQMLAIAQALVSNPSVLLIDEPSSGLAPVVVDEVLAIVDALKADDIAIVLVEQVVENVLSGLADDVVVLDGGRVVLADQADNLTVEMVAQGVSLS